jgi:hypothetical protein
MVSAIEILQNTQRLNRIMNQIRPPARFLTDQLFPESIHQTLRTELAEWDIRHGARQVAPMVRKNGAAILVGGLLKDRVQIEPFNIRIKYAIEPHQVFFERQPGETIYVGDGGEDAQAERFVAEVLGYMQNMVQNRIELLVGQALTGSITYAVADQGEFHVDFDRDTDLEVTLTGTALWSDAASDPSVDVAAAQSLMSERGRTITDAYMGSEAATQFRKNAAIKDQINTTSGIQAGQFVLASPPTEGAVFQGTYAGIRWWEYARTLTDSDVSATPVDLIRKKYVEFVDKNALDTRALLFAAIPEIRKQGDSVSLRKVIGKQFVKQLATDDPATMAQLLHSRPLPVWLDPDTWVSMKVVA